MEQSAANRKIVIRLLGMVGGMFFFGFALVPLYDVFCDITGINGKTGGRYAEAAPQLVDESRLVRVQFLASRNEAMPWQFQPTVSEVRVHPGAVTEISYIAVNTSGRHMVGQAVPSVSPGEGARYLHKVECFCFNRQPLAAGERKVMPVRFFVDPELPQDINTLYLSYTMFDAKPATVRRGAMLEGSES